MGAPDLLLGLGGLLLAGVSFVLGRVFSQSEAVLAAKRRVYEEVLTECPVPNDAYQEWSEELENDRAGTLNRVSGKLMLYAHPTVAIAFSRYLGLFSEAEQILNPSSPPLHPLFKDAAKAHNDLILEMRRDALGWSFWGYRGKTRLPADLLQNAKEKGLE